MRGGGLACNHRAPFRVMRTEPSHEACTRRAGGAAAVAREAHRKKIARERRGENEGARKANMQAGMMDGAACFRLVCRDEDWFEDQLFSEVERGERTRRFRRGEEGGEGRSPGEGPSSDKMAEKEPERKTASHQEGGSARGVGGGDPFNLQLLLILRSYFFFYSLLGVPSCAACTLPR